MLLLVTFWALYYILHSYFASESVKNRFQSHLGSNFRFYRLSYNFLSIVGFAGIWFYQRQIAIYRLFELNETVMGLGILIIAIGLVSGSVAFFQYRWQEFSGIDQIRGKNSATQNRLIITGFNRHVRHPLYFAGILILVGYFMANGTLQSLIFVLITFIYLIIGTRLEEKKLVNQFGDAYRDYQKRVKMLIPYVF